MKIPEYDNKLVRYLTPHQESKLLSLLPTKYQPIVIVAINSGSRQGELLRLTWADVDWVLGILTIRETKTGDSRRIPMNSITQTVLAQLIGDTTPDPTERVLPLDARHLRRGFEKAVKAAGLTPFRFHDLRHTFASRLAMQGANDPTLMALGGWKSPAMLSRYAHLSPTHLWKAVEGLAQIGTGSETGSAQQEGEREKTREPRATRTLGPRLKRAMLYQLS